MTYIINHLPCICDGAQPATQKHLFTRPSRHVARPSRHANIQFYQDFCGSPRSGIQNLFFSVEKKILTREGELVDHVWPLPSLPQLEIKVMMNKEKARKVVWPLLISAAWAGHGYHAGGAVGMVDTAAAIAMVLLAVTAAWPARRRRPNRRGLKRGVIMTGTGLVVIAEAIVSRSGKDVMPGVVLIGFGVGWIMHWHYSAQEA